MQSSAFGTPNRRRNKSQSRGRFSFDLGRPAEMLANDIEARGE